MTARAGAGSSPGDDGVCRCQGIVSVTCPGAVTWMMPAHRHKSWQVLSSAGLWPSVTVGAPGDQGAIVIGMQGCGVRTPSAAVVAAATIGLARLMHIPKDA